jgi:hypothetical protein
VGRSPCLQVKPTLILDEPNESFLQLDLLKIALSEKSHCDHSAPLSCLAQPFQHNEKGFFPRRMKIQVPFALSLHDQATVASSW